VKRRARRQLQRSSNAPRWQIVEVHATCAEGGHAIRRGEWALFWPFRYDAARMILCEAHAQAKGYERQDRTRPFTFLGDGEDQRARQTGEGE
jgi:hypothetical protein